MSQLTNRERFFAGETFFYRLPYQIVYTYQFKEADPTSLVLKNDNPYAIVGSYDDKQISLFIEQNGTAILIQFFYSKMVFTIITITFKVQQPGQLTNRERFLAGEKFAYDLMNAHEFHLEELVVSKEIYCIKIYGHHYCNVRDIKQDTVTVYSSLFGEMVYAEIEFNDMTFQPSQP